MHTPTLTRRGFLQSAALAAAWSALTACSSNSVPTQAPAETSGPTPALLPGADTDANLHLLRRISFGPKPGDLVRVRSIGHQAYIEEQLNYAALPDAEDRLKSLTLLHASPADLIDRAQAKQLNPALVLGELVVAKLWRALYSQQQLREVMADFWADHFNLYVLKNPTGLLLPTDDREVIHAHALGKFRDLLTASAHSPAMLTYLDNATSTAQGPNENYAREVMELHTLSVNGGYTQTDVHEVARALTGWSVAAPRDMPHISADQVGRFLYRPFIHDNGEKQILGVTLPAGGSQSDGDKVIDLLASHPSTAKFIARKLCVRFVSDDPPQSIVDRAAATFAQTDGDIQAILRTILTSDEFAASAGQKFKRPFEFIISTLRALNADVAIDANANLKPGTGDALRLNPLFQHLVELGQVPYLWPSPNGYPDTAAAWLNTGGMLGRWNFGLALVGGMRSVAINGKRLLGSVQTIGETVDRISTILLGTTLPDQPHSILIDYAQSASDEVRLPGLAALVIGSPQFQVR